VANPFPAKRDVRGRRIGARMIVRGACIHGHPTKPDDGSVYWDRDGRPNCATCVNKRMAEKAVRDAKARLGEPIGSIHGVPIYPVNPIGTITRKPAKQVPRKTVCSAPELEVRMHQLIGEIEREPLRYRRDELNAEFARLREQRDAINRAGFDRGE